MGGVWSKATPPKSPWWMVPRWSQFSEAELRTLRAKLTRSNNYDEPIAARLWHETNDEIQKR